MNKQVLRPDTPAWIRQSWLFFGMAALYEITAVLWLDVARGIKLLLMLVLVLTVYVCFALSKMIRDNRDGQVDSSPWVWMTWGVAGAALLGLGYGIYFISPDWRMRMVLGGGLAWCIEASFVLAKTIRDNAEAQASAAATRAEDEPTSLSRSTTMLASYPYEG